MLVSHSRLSSMYDPNHSAFIDRTKTFSRLLKSCTYHAQSVSASMKSMRLFSLFSIVAVTCASVAQEPPTKTRRMTFLAARLEVGAQPRNSVLARTFAGF